MDREQAKKQARELYGTSMSDAYSIGVSETLQKAYLRCWDDMNETPKLKYLNIEIEGNNSDHSL